MRPGHVIIALACIAALLLAGAARAASREEIDAEVREAIQAFHKHTSAGTELSEKAAGMLVFPSIVKAGFGVGGEYGEGALMVKGATAGYYNIVSASLGFQIGAQQRSVVLLFMTDQALAGFRASEGWRAGVDGSVAIATLGAGGAIDTDTVQKPIIGFMFSNKGLMYNLTIEGSKITKIDK